MDFAEVFEAIPKLPKQPRDYFRLVPQHAIRQTFVPEWPRHNAIWDMNVRRTDGRVFFSVCGEGQQPEYARLYEYVPADASMVCHFCLEKESIQQDRAIRASKFHTSIQFMDDGRLIMQTHTTSPAPAHPAWMPESYVNHQWESFQGSEVFVVEPDKGIVQSKGILSPYSSCYGGAYSNRAKLFFGIGIFDGYGYVYDLAAGAAACIGQVTDGRSNRLLEGPDGHIYYGTATGYLARLNVDGRRIEILAKTRENSPLRHGVFDHNGVLWFSARSGMSLYTYDINSGECREAGRFFEDGDVYPGKQFCYGFDFDSNGVLWFCSNVELESSIKYQLGSRLYKWDVRNGKDKVDYGFVGTERGRSIALSAQVCIHNDKLFVTDGNHLADPVGIVEIDLLRLDEPDGIESPAFSTDPINYMGFSGGEEHFPLGGAAYQQLMQKPLAFYESESESLRIQQANMSHASFCAATGVALWEELGYGNAGVRALHWENDSTLVGVCGEQSAHAFRLSLVDGQLHFHSAQATGNPVMPSALKSPVPEGINLPCMPGRQYLAKPKCSVLRKDGSLIVGTYDIMLAKVENGTVKGLGAVTTSGGVHWLTLAPDGMTVYGVAGYEMGKGDLFRYTDAQGLQWLGTVPITTTPTGRQLVSYQPRFVKCRQTDDVWRWVLLTP